LIKITLNRLKKKSFKNYQNKGRSGGTGRHAILRG
jgi:hypothetical protein